MTNIIKITLLLVSMAFASQAFAAECGGINLQFLGSDGKTHCSAEEANAADRARMNRFAGNSGVVLVQREPVYVSRPIVISAMPSGHAFRDCTPEEDAKRTLLLLVKGLAAGALIGDSTRSAGIGGGIGVWYSMTGSCRVAVRQVTTETLGNQGEIVGTVRKCSPDTSWKMLDWVGHPKHGQFACLPSDEVLAQQKASRKEPSSGEHVCTTPGTSWKKLDWPGHHQHDKFACLPSDDVLAQQKAASQKAP